MGPLERTILLHRHYGPSNYFAACVAQPKEIRTDLNQIKGCRKFRLRTGIGAKRYEGIRLNIRQHCMPLGNFAEMVCSPYMPW